MSKPRYIDANKIRLTAIPFESVNNGVYFDLSDIRRAIEQTPTADVVEVRYGKWQKQGNEKKCSLCEFIYYSNNDDFNFCPNCGAKMY